MNYRGMYVAIIADCGPNVGGYYCEVYETIDMMEVVDTFCVHADELQRNPSIEYWIKLMVDTWLMEEEINNESQNRSAAGEERGKSHALLGF